MNKKQNLIVGAGLSGSVLANLLATKFNENVEIIDKRNHIGGNIYDYYDEETNITVHKYGPHIFHTNNKEVWDYISKFTKWHYYFFKPNVIIEGNLVSLPFSLKTLYECFSIKMAEKIEEKLISTFGYGVKVPILKLLENNDNDLKFIANYIYDNIFKNYTIKQWGLKPEYIDETVSARVPIYISHDCRYFQDIYQGIPLNGYTQTIKNMLNHPNIKIQLSTDFDHSLLYRFDRIFYSGSIDEFFDYKYGKLPYRSLFFDIQKVNKEFYQKTAMTNYPNNYDFTRITEHKYFLNEKSNKTIISIEYPQEFKINENERYYPISNLKNNSLYSKYKIEAEQNKKIYFIGRLGQYKYYTMDSAVENIFKLFNSLNTII